MGDRQGPRGHDGTHRRSSRVVLGAGRRSSRVMVGEGGSGRWSPFIEGAVGCLGRWLLVHHQCRPLSFGCHVAVGDVVPDSDVKKGEGM